MTATNLIQKQKRPRIKITESEFLLIGIPVSREEFRENLRPLARFLAQTIYDKQQAERKIFANEPANYWGAEGLHPNTDEQGGQSLPDGIDAIPAID